MGAQSTLYSSVVRSRLKIYSEKGYIFPLALCKAPAFPIELLGSAPANQPVELQKPVSGEKSQEVGIGYSISLPY